MLEFLRWSTTKSWSSNVYDALINVSFHMNPSLFQHFNDFWILMVGRLLGGIATSILYSAFESWLVYEHNKVITYSSNNWQLTEIGKTAGKSMYPVQSGKHLMNFDLFSVSRSLGTLTQTDFNCTCRKQVKVH